MPLLQVPCLTKLFSLTVPKLFLLNTPKPNQTRLTMNSRPAAAGAVTNGTIETNNRRWNNEGEKKPFSSCLPVSVLLSLIAFTYELRWTDAEVGVEWSHVNVYRHFALHAKSQVRIDWAHTTTKVDGSVLIGGVGSFLTRFHHSAGNGIRRDTAIMHFTSYPLSEKVASVIESYTRRPDTIHDKIIFSLIK